MLEIIYNLRGILGMRKIIKTNRIDLLYERSAYFLLAGAYISRRYGVPLVVEANEVVGVKRARRLRLKKIASWIEKYTFNAARAIFVVSSFLQMKAEKILKNEVPVLVLPNAIDPALYERTTRRDEIREKLGISQKTVLGFVGWFDWWDRLDLILDLQKKIVEAGYTNVVTLLIGDGPVMPELKKNVETFNIEKSVILTGPVERAQVIDYMDAIDICILAHSNEFGSPVVLFEMMGLGKPIVAPALMPIKDVITHELNGLLFDPLDERELFENTVSMIDNPEFCRVIGKKGQEIVNECHTWVKNAEKVTLLLQMLARSK